MSTEETAPYGSGPAAAASPPAKRIRTHHLRDMKQRGEKFAMLTAYEQYAAQTFDEAGIEVLLVGDSASNNVYGNETSLPVTVDELIPLTRAVSKSVRRALVVGDLPFGSYQASPQQAYETAVRFMKEGGAHCVKLEGGREMAPQIELLTRGGVPGHGAHRLHPAERARPRRLPRPGARRGRPADPRRREGGRGRRRVRGGDGDGAGRRRRPGDPRALHPDHRHRRRRRSATAQVLVWQDAFGLRTGRMARFVKQYADLHGVLLDAAREYAADVKAGTFPGAEHTF